MNFDAQLAKIQRDIEAKNKNTNIDTGQDTLRDLTDNTITKSNALSRGYYRYDLVEKRCMEAMISKLHPLRNDNPQFITLSSLEYSKTYGVDSKNSYKQLSNAVDGLLKQLIVVTEGTAIIKTPLMYKAIYEKNKGEIRAAFHPEIVPSLVGLRNKFSSYPLKNAADFTSSYTWRFYELLVSWAQPKKDTGDIFAGWIKHQSVDELRKMLGVPDSYSWGMFNKKILDVVSKELLEKSRIHVNIKRIKTSRKITHLNIEFIEDDQQQLTLNGGDTKRE